MNEAEKKRDPNANVAALARGDQVIGPYIHDAQSNGGLDNTRRRVQQIQGGKRQGDAVRDRERSYDLHQRRERSAQKEQADDGQYMVRTDQTVLDSRGGELPHDRGGAPTGSRLIVEGVVN